MPKKATAHSAQCSTTVARAAAPAFATFTTTRAQERSGHGAHHALPRGRRKLLAVEGDGDREEAGAQWRGARGRHRQQRAPVRGQVGRQQQVPARLPGARQPHHGRQLRRLRAGGWVLGFENSRDPVQVGRQ